MTTLGWVITVIGMMLTAIGGIFAHENDMFWPSQVITKWGQAGIAYATHAAVYSDFLLLSPFCGWVVSQFGHRWSEDLVVFGYKPGFSILTLALVIGFAIAAGNHVQLCANQKIPDPWGWQKEWWTATIGFHFIFFWAVATIFVAMCFTPGIDAGTVLLLALFLGLHMTFGIHIPTGIANRFVRSEKLPEFLHGDSLKMLGGIWVLVTLAGGYASGDWRTLLWIALAGVVIVFGTMVVMTDTRPIGTQ